jgi:peptidoglycan/LPS O-acetylase OafA/YrhL
MKTSYYKELDGVRAIAALMVMFFHFFQMSNTANYFIAKLAIFGQTGVSLFFVLSGFLITRILFKTKGSPNFFSNFYVRRALRIFPLYYLFLFIYYFVVPFIIKAPITPFGSQIYYWIYLQNFADTFKWKTEGPEHFWSLAVEEHFYLFWPLMIYFFNKQRIVIAIFLIIIIAFIVRIILVKYNFGVFYFTFSRIDELAVGALLAVLELNGKLVQKNATKFLLSFCGIMIPTLCIWIFFTGEGNNLIQITKFILLSFSYFSLIGFIITATKENWLKKILITKGLTYTGKISYGLYVYHPLCFYLFNLFFKTKFTPVNFVLSFSFAYLTATVSYYFFEAKFLRIKDYFNYNMRAVEKPVN